MTDIPAEAIQAAADALHEAGCSEAACHYAMHVNAPTDGDRQIAEIALEAAEQVWPHDPPKRDPASTTNAVTERAWTAPRRTGSASAGT